MSARINYKFVLSLGRSGTKFFSSFLEKALEEGVFEHEPFYSDRQVLYFGYANSHKKFRDAHLSRRFSRIERKFNDDFNGENGIYGEVNSYLRYETDWLKKNLDADVMFIARDVYSFIVSAFGRNILTDQDLQQWIVPKDDDTFTDRWFQLSRVEQLAWYWKKTNEELLAKSDGKVRRMESLLSDYEYCQKSFQSDLNIQIDKKIWTSERMIQKNTSRWFNSKKKLKTLLKLRARSEANKLYLTEEEKSKIEIICGETREKIGYE